MRLLLLTVLAMLMLPCWAGERNKAERAAFARENPCPATGKPAGACPGWVVDHIEPLCAGGPDRRWNMQWQSVQEGKTKDRLERVACRLLRL